MKIITEVCYGGVSSACRAACAGSGQSEKWFTYTTGDLEAGATQLSHETCSITDCQRKEQNSKTHTQSVLNAACWPGPLRPSSQT